jgi:hypothetical protein
LRESADDLEEAFEAYLPDVDAAVRSDAIAKLRAALARLASDSPAAASEPTPESTTAPAAGQAAP